MARHQDVSSRLPSDRSGLVWWHGGYFHIDPPFTAELLQLFGWDTGLIGGVLTMDAFQESFNLDAKSSDFANLQGNIVSVLQAGCFFGALASFYVSDTFGRKWALIIADIIFIIGSLIQTLCAIGTTSLAQLYVGRVIGGFGVGLISAVVPTYISENAPKEIRGRCVGCMQLFNVTGICLSFFVNYGINLDITSRYNSAKWRVPFALQMLPGVILLTGIVFMNESPRWLIEKNRITDAAKALAHVRGKPAEDPDVAQELDDIIADFNGHEKMPMVAQLKSACSNKKIFYRSSFAVVLMFWQQWTGTNSINYYAPQIFKQIGLTGGSAGLFATGVYGIVKIVVTAIGLMAFTEQLGRKWSLLIGSAGQAFAMFYIGINQAVHPPTGELDGNAIFAIICVYLFVVFYSFGWGPIPFVLSSECAPNHVRSLIMAAALMTQWLFNFIIAKITPASILESHFGICILTFPRSCSQTSLTVPSCSLDLAVSSWASTPSSAYPKPRVYHSSLSISCLRAASLLAASKIPSPRHRARRS